MAFLDLIRRGMASAGAAVGLVCSHKLMQCWPLTLTRVILTLNYSPSLCLSGL